MFDFLQTSLPQQTLIAVNDLARANYLIPSKSSSRNRENVLSGRLHLYPVLSILTQRVTAFDKGQIRAIHALQAILFLWLVKTATENNLATTKVPNKINRLCQKIRNYSKSVEHPIIWPSSTLSESELILELFDKQSNVGKLFDLPDYLNLSEAAIPQESIPALRDKVDQPGKSQQARVKKRDIIQELPPEKFTQRKIYNLTDVEAITDVFEEVDNENSLKHLTFHERIARLASAQYISAMDNQFLPYAWEFLNPIEQAKTVETIKNDSPSKLRTLAILTIATSLDCDQLFYAQIVDKFDEESTQIQISGALNIWFSKFPTLKGKFVRQPNEHDYLEPVIQKLFLPLPIEADGLISVNTTTTLGELLGFPSPKDMKSALDKYCLQVRSRGNNRLTPLKLRSLIFNKLISNISDEVKSSYAINNDEFSPSIALYYASFEAADLQNLIVNAIREMGLTIHENEYLKQLGRYGSELFWAPEHHKAHIKNIIGSLSSHREINASTELHDIIKYHNDYVSYVGWMLHCATGHRERNSFTIDAVNISEEWLLVNDKVKEYENPRLVKISKQLQLQLNQYNEHLIHLSKALKKYNKDLSKYVGTLSQNIGRNLNSIPYFFYLSDADDIKPSPISTRAIFESLGLPRNIQRNIQRHWYITGLREKGLPAEWILASSGHSGIGQLPYTYTSLYPIKAYEKSWDDYVDSWLLELGFEVVPTSLSFAHGHIPKLGNVELSKAILRDQLVTRPPPVRIEQLVYQEIKRQQIVEFENEKHFNQFIDKLGEANDWTVHQKCAAINHLHTFLDRMPRNGNSNQFNLHYAPQYEASPILNDHILNVRRINYLRAEIINHLPDELSILSNKEVEGLLVISLIINCGIGNHKDLKALWAQIRHSLVRCNDHVWFEWYEEGRLVRRFIDVVSLSLYIELNRRNRFSIKIPEKASSQLLRKMTSLSTLFLNLDYELNLNQLLRITKSWFFDSLPGQLAAACAGDLKITHLRKHNLVRVLDGHFIKEDLSISYDSKPNLNWVKQSQTPDLKELMQSFQQLLDILSKGLTKTQSISPQTKKLNRKELKQEIESLRQNWIRNEYSSLLVTLASYAIEKLGRKKKSGEFIRIRTVIDYVRSAGVPLLSISFQDNWLDLLEDELEQYYLYALSFNGTNKKARLAKRLRFFHDHCVEQYGQPELILENLDQAFIARYSDSKVRASVITTQEYETTHQLIFQTKQLSEINKSHLSLLAILVFRFGLRVSEALSLDTRDICISNKHIIVLVRANKLGRPKTRAGFRQVPLSHLPEQELARIQSVLSKLSARFSGDDAAIFSNLESPWEVFSASILSQQLLSILKHVTGSQKTVIHDARHTFASAITTLTMTDNANSLKGIKDWFNPGEYQRFMLGHSYATRRLSFAIACQLGHASNITTAESYCHLVEVPLFEYLNSLLPSIRTTKLSSWFNIKDNTIRQLKRRANDQHDFINSLILKAVEKAGIRKEELVSFDPIGSYQTLPLPSSNTISLQQLEFVVTEILNGCDHAWLEKHLFLENEKARLITQIVRNLAEETQIKRIWRNESLFNFAQNQAHKSKILVNALSNDASTTSELAKIWKDNFITEAHGLLIGDTKSRERFIELVESTEGLTIEVRTNDIKQDKGQKQGHVITQSRSYRVNALHKNKRVKTGQILIGLKDDLNSSSNRLMVFAHRFFFIACVQNLFEKKSVEIFKKYRTIN
ncbi:tyrosine-type recombinase/integrase [Alteromonas facilis]|uniref:tyrosine-type recombinase/integrase n=1 Tax=Alteromonas facilis TaxID=2048004 RepID=UPI000C2876B9|nr:tyrosine-type recombinase/integrase [Alteromonas facilis]